MSRKKNKNKKNSALICRDKKKSLHVINKEISKTSQFSTVDKLIILIFKCLLNLSQFSPKTK